MNFYWKIVDSLRKRKTIVGHFIIDNKIATIYVLRKYREVYFLKYKLRKYKLPLLCNKKLPKNISSWLDDYFDSNNRVGVNNWEWLIETYSATCDDDSFLNIKKLWRYDEFQGNN